MAGFVKLDCGIVDSTVWTEPHDVLRVWIALLAKCDAVGIVRGSVPALALLCMVPVPRMVEILDRLASPDPFSRTPDNDGRRIEPLKDGGGWLILNYVKHREITQGKSGSHAERQRRYRERLAERDASLSVTRDERYRHEASPKRHRDTEGEEEEAEEEKNKSSLSSSSEADDPPKGTESGQLKLTPPTDISGKRAQRVHQITLDAITAFNAKLGKPNGLLPSVSLRVGLKKRQKQVTRILEVAGEICEEQYGSKRITPEFWKAYFVEVDRDPFKSGRQEPGRDHKNWKPTFEYLTRDGTMLEVFERAQSADDAA